MSEIFWLYLSFAATTQMFVKREHPTFPDVSVCNLEPNLDDVTSVKDYVNKLNDVIREFSVSSLVRYSDIAFSFALHDKIPRNRLSPASWHCPFQYPELRNMEIYCWVCTQRDKQGMALKGSPSQSYIRTTGSNFWYQGLSTTDQDPAFHTAMVMVSLPSFTTAISKHD